MKLKFKIAIILTLLTFGSFWILYPVARLDGIDLINTLEAMIK